MIRWRWGTVRTVGRHWRGAVELEVALVARGPDDPAAVRALAYPAMVGHPEEGDRVLLNCNALALGLGTGGYAMVVALPDRLPADVESPGHVVKARYTPQQVIVCGVDEEASPIARAWKPPAPLAGPISPGCRWWRPISTRRCQPSSPGSSPTGPPRGSPMS